MKRFFTIFFVFYSCVVFGQSNEFQFSKLDIGEGLSHNQVNCILKDHSGFMWFGTLSGLSKYDGYKFKIFKHEESDTVSLSDDFMVSLAEGPDNNLWVETRNGFNIYDPLKEIFSHNITGALKAFGVPSQNFTALKKDKVGNFWFLNSFSGIYKYNPLTKKTEHISYKPGGKASIYSNAVADLSVDAKGNIWLVYNKGILERLDPLTHKVNYRRRLSELPTGLNTSYKVFIDRQDDVWAYVPSYSSGVYYLNSNTTTFRHLDKDGTSSGLNTNVIASVVQDDHNRVWIATDHGGINLLNKADFKTRYLLNREDDKKTLGQNSLTTLYKDNTGIIWAGTYKCGISYYHESIIKFPLYTHHLSDPGSLSFSDVNKFIEDDKGNLWLGTNGGGLVYFNRKNGSFKRYMHDAANNNSLTNNVIVNMYLDHEQKLWIGTYFGGLDKFDGKTFTHYRHRDNDPGSISEDRIWSIIEDRDNNLWVGTLAGGLNLLNRSTNSFKHYKMMAGSSNSMHSSYVAALLDDRHKNLWIVTSYGVDVLNRRTEQFMHYVHDDKDPNSLVNNNTNNILEDSSGLIWISTREGISILNTATGKFKNITKQDGLPDNTVIDLREDDAHNIWASTPNGLSNIIVDRKSAGLPLHFINYNEKDGLQGREFTANSSFKTRKGELIFGGGNGFNIFKPASLRNSTNAPKLAFTDFQVFNKSVKAGEKIFGNVILPKAISHSDTVELKYNENVFSVEFAALNYFDADKVKYEYMMQGFNKNWISADNLTRKATYTNLDAGDYTFKVRAANPGFWKSKELTLYIKILPPFWKTTVAYILYALLFIGILLFIRSRGIRKLRLEFLLEKEREEAQRMHDLDLMKIRFFTNVSHEFRTPLSLIIAPVDNIVKQIAEPGIKKQLLLVNRNAKRLLNLVNQLLDFRKMEYQELKLHKTPGDIVEFIRDLSYSFTDVAEQKQIGFVFDSEIEEYYTSFDYEKIERILFNLLSNAYKFTHAGGQVSVLLNLKSYTAGGDNQFEIRVIDTGIGIHPDKQEKIFEPFFQNDIPGTMLNQGSGIGLSIVKEFVRLHAGELTVESELNQGSCFTVMIPLQELNKNLFTDKPVHLQHYDENSSIANNTEIQVRDNRDGKKPVVLLVEDNDDFRFYIKDNLKDSFQIIEAENGKRGWQKALAQHPNLIVSDITMPEMNGIDLCIKIKNDKRTSHIPVILLTAVAGEEQQLKGLGTGATDYMTKPFNFEILLSKIRNILLQQEHMRKTYQKQVEANPTELIVDSPDEGFIKKVLMLIDNNIANPNFSVEELSNEMFVSRYTLYKKTLQMTGKTPNELVRQMRLKRAAQLLETGHLTISQICNKVGFKSQKYFVKTFKAEYDMLPSRYAETHQQ
ncbi:ATP-binding protein [Mucilaginibacter sp. RB4R14]|uniref:hybrid sensor histidine kinase/response regulator transcription factor n=1 Tax=Mucilaginibacter aurantiaciroseus TaxID=2949308 RepID=UPI002091E357|nr:hybrid sensor histidine kinase/response regulator transcription factor [Mucilaginibacter aurantiaciroseus]MCO5937130.1 ATP-binding protein [Mucilaginibacter aurantiaciroseus]